MRNSKTKKGENSKYSINTFFMWILLLVYLSPLYIVFNVALKSKEDFAKKHIWLA